MYHSLQLIQMMWLLSIIILALLCWRVTSLLSRKNCDPRPFSCKRNLSPGSFSENGGKSSTFSWNIIIFLIIISSMRILAFHNFLLVFSSNMTMSRWFSVAPNPPSQAHLQVLFGYIHTSNLRGSEAARWGSNTPEIFRIWTDLAAKLHFFRSKQLLQMLQC